MRRAIVVLTALALVLSACSSGSERTTSETRTSSSAATTAATAPAAVSTDATATVTEVSAEAAEATDTVAPSPTVAATKTPAPTATATAEPVKADLVVGKWIKRQPQYSDNAQIVGEVLNQGTGDAQSIQVAVTAYDASGAVLGSGRGQDLRPVIPAGEKSPFMASISGVAVDQIADVKIQVQSEPFDKDSYFAKSYVTNIPVTQIKWDENGIAGEVSNASDTAANLVGVSVIGYTETGDVFGVYYTVVQLNQVDPGMTAPFSASYLGYEGAPAKVEAWASGFAVK